MPQGYEVLVDDTEHFIYRTPSGLEVGHQIETFAFWRNV